MIVLAIIIAVLALLVAIAAYRKKELYREETEHAIVHRDKDNYIINSTKK
ncbi:hypothetical protein [Croceivirga sp. JEA036]|nr:hypothetical protein [Croceivirga sp. JEA036]NJB36394.1 hypothetical protein [Croceivirga sp. JEA036]